MSSLKYNLHPDITAAGKSRPNAPEPKASAPNTQQPSNIAHILKAHGTISTCLNLRTDRKPEAFILLADDLSDSERDALLQASDTVVDIHGDLIRKLAEAEKENKHLRSLSLTDDLTSLYNYRFFSKQLEIEIARTRRTGHPCSLMMIDLDNFKELNDTHGHVVGNNFLVEVARTIGQKLRPIDILCRYGGDEFAVIMPATGLFDAMRIGQRLREFLSKIPWKLDGAVSASIGLAEHRSDSKYEASEFINMADRALYKAKKNGKNRICFEAPPEKRVETKPVSHEEREVLLKRDDRSRP
jgi:two-component system cell cycle response regulator